MKIVVNHLTRMQPGYICVAGIDLATGKAVRPVLENGRLGSVMLVRERGAFEIGAVVDLGPTRAVGHAPEVEDQEFNRRSAHHLSDMPSAEFWKLLERTACNRLTDIFGKDLKPTTHGAAVELHKGKASLGCLRPAEGPPSLKINPTGKLRLHLVAGSHDLALSVTDIRLYETDQRTPRRAQVENVNRRIAAGVGVLLSVGLGRAWLKEGDAVERHWLQVNNIHLHDNPTWKDADR
ncbi:MAG: dual OB domain-containing protein [Chloroflexia bacterium]